MYTIDTLGILCSQGGCGGHSIAAVCGNHLLVSFEPTSNACISFTAPRLLNVLHSRSARAVRASNHQYSFHDVVLSISRKFRMLQFTPGLRHRPFTVLLHMTLSFLSYMYPRPTMHKYSLLLILETLYFSRTTVPARTWIQSESSSESNSGAFGSLSNWYSNLPLTFARKASLIRSCVSSASAPSGSARSTETAMPSLPGPSCSTKSKRPSVVNRVMPLNVSCLRFSLVQHVQASAHVPHIELAITPSHSQATNVGENCVRYSIPSDSQFFQMRQALGQQRQMLVAEVVRDTCKSQHTEFLK